MIGSKAPSRLARAWRYCFSSGFSATLVTPSEPLSSISASGSGRPPTAATGRPALEASASNFSTPGATTTTLLPCDNAVPACSIADSASGPRQSTTPRAWQDRWFCSGRPRHFFITFIQRRRQVTKVRLERLLPAFWGRSIHLRQLIDQFLYLTGRNGFGIGRSRLFNNLAFDETAHILRATGFRTSTRQAFAAEWLGADNGADLVTVHVGVAHLYPAGNMFDAAIHTAVDTEGQAVALGIDGIHHLVDVLGREGGHMQHGAEDFLFHLFNAADLEHCRRHKPTFFRHWQLLQQLALLLECLAVVGNFLAGVLVNHRAHIRGQQPGVANTELFHGAVKHFQQVIGNVLLHIEHPQRRTALAGTLE